jgi:hypothetical protein
MFIKECNINETDRINRVVIGVLLLLSVFFGITEFFAFLLGLILIVQGVIGWCSIPYLRDLIKNQK